VKEKEAAMTFFRQSAVLMSVALGLSYLLTSAVARGQSDPLLSEITVLSTAGADAEVYADDRGLVHVAYHQDAPFGLWYARSLSFADEFEPPFRQPSGDIGLAKRIASDLSGLVCVSWEESRAFGNDLFVNVSQDYGENWGSAPVLVGPAIGNTVYFSQIALDEGSHVYAAWGESRDTPSPMASSWVSRSIDGGLSFEPPQILTDGGSTPMAVRATGDGAVAVVELAGSGGRVQIRVWRSLDWGATWLGPTIVNPAMEDLPIYSCDLAWGCGGLLFVTWTGERDLSTDVYFARSLDYGASFESHLRLNTSMLPGASESDDAEIAADQLGNAYVAWLENARPRFNSSRDGGATWTGDVPLSLTSVGYIPRLAANASGHVAVTWNSIEPTTRGIQLNVSRDFGATWLAAPVRLDDPDKSAHNNNTAIDSAGRVTTTWTESYVIGEIVYLEVHVRSAYPSLASSAVPTGDDDGTLVIPPQVDRMEIEFTLRNHHPTDRLTGLMTWLEAILPDGRTIGPIIDPKTFNLPAGERKRAVLRRRFPARFPPGWYTLVLRSTGPVEDAARLPILKQ
jgi:hypothetical protein